MNILELLAIKINSGFPKLDATDVLDGVLSIFYFIVGALAVVIIILAGLQFMTSSGDPAKITKARMAILYSVIGLVVVMFAFAITKFVLGRF
jgi:heme O synthase-like polyprenyltransferase